jgi:hypothetical protein
MRDKNSLVLRSDPETVSHLCTGIIRAVWIELWNDWTLHPYTSDVGVAPGSDDPASTQISAFTFSLYVTAIPHYPHRRYIAHPESLQARGIRIPVLHPEKRGVIRESSATGPWRVGYILHPYCSALRLFRRYMINRIQPVA